MLQHAGSKTMLLLRAKSTSIESGSIDPRLLLDALICGLTKLSRVSGIGIFDETTILHLRAMIDHLKTFIITVLASPPNDLELIPSIPSRCILRQEVRSYAMFDATVILP